MEKFLKSTIPLWSISVNPARGLTHKSITSKTKLAVCKEFGTVKSNSIANNMWISHKPTGASLSNKSILCHQIQDIALTSNA